MKRLLTITGPLILLVCPSFARECSPLPIEGSEAFHYVYTLIDSFGYIKSATTTLKEQSAKAQKPGAADAVGTTTDLMLSMKQASEDYECAATMIKAFAKSKDETIAASAEATSTLYERILTLNADLQILFRQMLDRKLSASEMSDKLSTNSVERDETWRLLIKSGSLATFPLVVLPKNENEKLSELNITAAQRNELRTKLERIYGPNIKKGFVAGLALADSPAHLIYEWLNKDWKLLPNK